MIELRHLAVDLLDCSYCGQPAGTNCKTSGGFWSSWPHSARFHPVWEAWKEGWHDGRHDVVLAIDNNQPGEPYADQAWLGRYLERIRKEASARA